MRTEEFIVRISTAAPIAFASDVMKAISAYMNRHEGSRVRYEDQNRGVVIEVSSAQSAAQPLSVDAVDPVE